MQLCSLGSAWISGEDSSQVADVKISQDLHQCDLSGRDCIEKKSNQTFNCWRSCDGIYAYIYNWEYDGDWLTLKDMIEPLILEYENFKQNYVKHFRFNAKNDSSDFGKLKFWMRFYKYTYQHISMIND